MKRIFIAAALVAGSIGVGAPANAAEATPSTSTNLQEALAGLQLMSNTPQSAASGRSPQNTLISTSIPGAVVPAGYASLPDQANMYVGDVLTALDEAGPSAGASDAASQYNAWFAKATTQASLHEAQAWLENDGTSFVAEALQAAPPGVAPRMLFTSGGLLNLNILMAQPDGIGSIIGGLVGGAAVIGGLVCAAAEPCGVAAGAIIVGIGATGIATGGTVDYIQMQKGAVTCTETASWVDFLMYGSDSVTATATLKCPSPQNTLYTEVEVDSGIAMPTQPLNVHNGQEVGQSSETCGSTTTCTATLNLQSPGRGATTCFTEEGQGFYQGMVTYTQAYDYSGPYCRP